MIGSFNLPSVDHLREGIDYRVVEWDFAASAPGQGCGEGEKMVFGVCRKLRNAPARDDKDFDSSVKTKQEEELAKSAGKLPTTKEEAVAANAKGFTAGGKKCGWAIKDGKPVMVEWGSVAGTKPKTPAPAPTTVTGLPAPASGSPAPAPAPSPGVIA
jgi:hypothetical protein